MRRALLIATAFVTSACLGDSVCDPGQYYELGNCFAEISDAGPSTDAAIVDAGPMCTPGPGNYEGFGRPCSSNSDCTGCIAPTCATAPINQCSRVQCQNDPEVCPPGWECTDISGFSPDPAVTHICLQL